jgi:hypothetical protein
MKDIRSLLRVASLWTLLMGSKQSSVVMRRYVTLRSTTKLVIESELQPLGMIVLMVSKTSNGTRQPWHTLRIAHDTLIWLSKFHYARYCTAIFNSAVTGHRPPAKFRLGAGSQHHIAVHRRPEGHKMTNNKYFLPMGQKHTAENAVCRNFWLVTSTYR